MMKVFFLAGLLSLVAMAAEGCTCGSRGHPQEAVCNAKLFVRATVTKVTPIFANIAKNTDEDGNVYEYTGLRLPRELKYDLKIHKVFGDDGSVDSTTDPFYLYTEGDSAMCGAVFEEGEDYIISISNGWRGKPWTGLCEFNKRWSRLAVEERKLFENRAYEKACEECNVRNCHYGHCRTNNDECTYDRFTFSDNKCWTEGLCVRHESGKCDWNKKACREPENEYDGYPYYESDEDKDDTDKDSDESRTTEKTNKDRDETNTTDTSEIP